MARRGDKVNAEALAVVHRAGQPGDFDFTAVARTGIHFPNGQGAAQQATGRRSTCLTSSYSSTPAGPAAR